VLAGGMERFRQLYEHHPRSLSIVVDGDILAKRDISSASSELMVQTGKERDPNIVEVVSEQNIPMLTFYVGALPPQAPPEQSQEVELSDGRKLELRLQFTGEGTVVEVFYRDPTLLTAAHDSAESFSEAEDGLGEIAAMTPKEIPAAIENKPRSRPWWRWFLNRIKMNFPEMNPMLATAMVCAAAAIVFLVLSLCSVSVIKPGEMLQRAAAAESRAGQPGPGVVVETVRIQTPRRKLERTIYRDIQGKRRAKNQGLSQAEATVRKEIEDFDIPWNDPLSVASFRDWHDRVTVEREVVKRPKQGLLTLTTTVAEGAIASESLTVRESDFHAVERTVQLRGAETVEIAELNYSVLPWNSVNPDLFEPVSDAGPVMGSNVQAVLHPLIPHTLSPVEIDEAELSARLVLNRLRLDTNDRVELVRQPDGVEVKGVVADKATQRQIQAQLYTVPHVSASILTLQQMDARPEAGSDVTSIRQSSIATEPTPSAIERYFAGRGLDRTAASAPVQELVDSSFTVKHESEQIDDLLSRFSANETLSGSGRTNLSELLIQHKAALLAALAREDRQLSALQLVPHSTVAGSDPARNADTLRGATERNFALCAELTSERNASARPAQAISAQLVDSIAKLRSVVLHISSTAQLSAPSLDGSTNANQNR